MATKKKTPTKKTTRRKAPPAPPAPSTAATGLVVGENYQKRLRMLQECIYLGGTKFNVGGKVQDSPATVKFLTNQS